MEPASGEPSTCSGSQRQLSVSFGSPPASPAKPSASPRLSASSDAGLERPLLRPITRSPSPHMQLPNCPIEYEPDGDNRCTLIILFRSDYDVCFFRLQQLHPFDTRKWSKIASLLRQKVFERTGQPLTMLQPTRPASDQDLLLAHTEEYIQSVTHSRIPLLKAFETPLLGCFPMCVIRRKLLRPFRWQVAGSLLAAHLALSFGYAINLGGGFHHCSSTRAAGFCIFADISIMMHYVWSHIDQRMRILIADLDAHQGNGYAQDAADLDVDQRRRLMIVDLFNRRNYPSDESAKVQIDKRVELRPHTKDNVYLEYLRINMEEAIDEFDPNFIIYNAGTDVLINDPLGGLDISEDGIIRRDEMMFKFARKRRIPIAMLTSGGYQSNNPPVIVNSIMNLFEKGLINRSPIKLPPPKSS